MDSSTVEELASELEALESIYADDFRLLSSLSVEAGGDLPSFEIDIRSREVPTGPGGKPEIVSCCLHFEYTPGYPNAAPLCTVMDTQNLTEAGAESLVQLMEATCQESLGMVMVFSVVSAVQDALQDAAERLEDTRRLADEQRRRHLEEEERRKFVGTPVTLQSFAEWRRRFDEEMAAAKAKAKASRDAGGAGGKKATGKELFMADNRFDVSDLQILQSEEEQQQGGQGGDAVEVDESLFQNLDELDLLDQAEGV